MDRDIVRLMGFGVDGSRVAPCQSCLIQVVPRSGCLGEHVLGSSLRLHALALTLCIGDVRIDTQSG